MRLRTAFCTRERRTRQNRSATRRLLILLVSLAGLPWLPARAHAAVGPTDSGTVAAPRVKVVVVDGLTIDDLRSLAPRAAVGLLVPGAGPSTNRSYAIASLAHGLDLNAAVRLPRLGRALVRVRYSDFAPMAPNTIVLSLPTNSRLARNDRRYAIAVRMPGYSGLLTSPTTRIPGLVSIADIAPTALGRLRGSLGHIPSADPVAQLARLDARIHSNNRLKLPILLIVAGAMLLLTLVRPGSTVPALLAALVSSLGAGAAGVASEPLLIAIVTAGTVLGGVGLAHLCRDDRRLLAAIVLVLLLHVVLLVTRPEWVAVSPLGPTQISRFWGIGNQLETLLLAPVVLGASLASRRYGLIGFGLFSIFVLVMITDNRLGSDGGGAIVFGVALAFVGTRSLGLGRRGFGILLGIAAAVVLMVILINLRAPGPDHLRSAFSGGISGLALVLANRIPLAYLPAIREWPLFGSLACALVLILALALRTSDRHARWLVVAAGAALVTSLLANDSAVYELAGGVGVIGALARVKVPFAAGVTGAPARSQLVRTPLLATTKERGEE